MTFNQLLLASASAEICFFRFGNSHDLMIGFYFEREPLVHKAYICVWDSYGKLYVQWVTNTNLEWRVSFQYNSWWEILSNYNWAKMLLRNPFFNLLPLHTFFWSNSVSHRIPEADVFTGVKDTTGLSSMLTTGQCTRKRSPQLREGDIGVNKPCLGEMESNTRSLTNMQSWNYNIYIQLFIYNAGKFICKVKIIYGIFTNSRSYLIVMRIYSKTKFQRCYFAQKNWSDTTTAIK